MPFFQRHRTRLGRISEVGRVYFITTNIQDREPVFADWTVGRLLVKAMAQEEADGNAVSMAWVVMPDHLHWLVELRVGTLSSLVRRVKSRSARAVNERLGRDAKVWQAGFYDHAVRKDEDIKHIARYMLANPLRAGLVERIGDYPLWDAMWL